MMALTTKAKAYYTCWWEIATEVYNNVTDIDGGNTQTAQNSDILKNGGFEAECIGKAPTCDYLLEIAETNYDVDYDSDDTEISTLASYFYPLTKLTSIAGESPEDFRTF